jgi:hypothetical protein
MTMQACFETIECIQAQKHPYMHACMHKYLHIKSIQVNTKEDCMHACVYACMHRCKQPQVQRATRAHWNTRIPDSRGGTHTHTHTHTHEPSNVC